MKNSLFKFRVPILFGSALVIFMCGLLIMENMMKDINQESDQPASSVVEPGNDTTKTTGAEDSANEVLVRPCQSEVKLVRYFYRSSDDSERQSASLDYFEGVYRPSLGVDFSQDGTAFDVMAAVSGTIKEVKTDPLFGKCLVLEGNNGMVLTYQSLSDIHVKTGDTVKQGTVIATSGENVYEAELGNHLHFVLEKDGVAYDPELNFNKKTSELE